MLSIKTSSTVFLAEKIMHSAIKNQLNIKMYDKYEPRAIPLKNPYLLYMHVPFCHTFCTYCSFHKFHYDEELAKRYFKNLREEMKKVKDEGFEFDSIYVGGGTTLINESELIKTLELAKELFGVEEISCETDPSHIQKDMLKNFQGLIKRLSVGVQSFDDDILKSMGRYAKFGGGDEIRAKLEDMVGVLPVTSLDLIFNIPAQNETILKQDLDIAKQTGAEQITTYPLMVSEVTRKSITKTLGVKSSKSEYEYYKLILEELKDYHQNNSWSFSKTKIDLKDEYGGAHNEYIGIGSGAFSFTDGTLNVNTYNLEQYEKNIKTHGSSYMAYCNFKKSDRIKYLFLNTLFDGGVDIKAFNKTNKTDISKSLAKELGMLKFAKAVHTQNGVIKPNDFGRYITLVMMREFYSGMDKVRAMFRES